MADKKLRILITAGGTREFIDPVRFISNASSGRMGYALAQAAVEQGCSVTLITAPANMVSPLGAKVIKVETAAQMFAAVQKKYSECDCLIMAAAVSDYTPAKMSSTKLKKTGKNLVLMLKPTVDILAWAGKEKKNQFLVGFALEDKNLKARAKKKLIAKNLDMIVANTPDTIAADTAVVKVLTSGGKWCDIGRRSKKSIAKMLIKLIVSQLFSSRLSHKHGL
jgi:phosphopantothenoylcysteine synthetase/decarboxylase